MRVAAYCRVSTDREEQLSSLENQQDFFKQYAEKNNDVLVGIYADKGISGKSMLHREAFAKLLDDAERNKFDYVAVKDVSRFARNTSDFLYGIRKLKQYGIDVRFLSGNQTVLGESEFVLTVFAALAQEESANLSKRVIFGKRQNAKKGRVPNLIYGYDKKDTYTLTVNEYEGETVRRIFEKYAKGEGVRQIAEYLNDIKVPTKKHTSWLPRTVQRILVNPIYTGRLINNKSTTKDFLNGIREQLPESEWYVHERQEYRIVSDDLFNAVQKKFEERKNMYGKSARHSGKHIFSNVIQCGVCGKSFIARNYAKGVIYKCASRNVSSDKCTNKSIVSEIELVEAVRKYILSQVDKESIKYAENISKESISNEIFFAENAERLAKRRKKIKEMYIMGAIGEEEVKSELKGIENGLKALENEKKKAVCFDFDEVELNNDDMRRLIEKIVITEDAAEIYIRQDFNL